MVPQIPTPYPYIQKLMKYGSIIYAFIALPSWVKICHSSSSSLHACLWSINSQPSQSVFTGVLCKICKFQLPFNCCMRNSFESMCFVHPQWFVLQGEEAINRYQEELTESRVPKHQSAHAWPSSGTICWSAWKYHYQLYSGSYSFVAYHPSILRLFCNVFLGVIYPARLVSQTETSKGTDII